MTLPPLLARVLSTALVGAVGAAGLYLDPTAIGRTDAAPPSAVQAPMHLDFPNYDGHTETRMGEGLRVNGQRVDLRFFYTDDIPDAVADYYEEAFFRLRPQVQRRRLGEALYVGVLADDGRMLAVTIYEQDDGTSLVVPSVSAGAMIPGAEKSQLPIPIPTQHESLLTYASDDGDKHAVSAQFISPAPLSDVTLWYRDELRSRGYNEMESGFHPEHDGNFVLRFFRPGGERASVGLQGLTDGSGTVVFILYEQIGASAP